MMEWLRWYHGACSDPKWPLIARKSGVNVGVVVSVWVSLLEQASQDEERGSVADFDGETFDALYGYDDGTCSKVVAAMVEKGLIKDGCISAWGRRQVRDEGAAERKRLQREREKLEKERLELDALRHELSQEVQAGEHDPAMLDPDVTGGHDVSRSMSPSCHGMSQSVTECHLDQNREDKNKIKNILKPNIHTENEDPARDTRSGQVGVGEEVALPVDECSADRRLDGSFGEPSVEFQELRDWYSAHCKPEGIMAGFIEFKQAKSAHTWPGQTRIYDDLSARSESSKWKRGFAPSLANYLRTQGWTAPQERDETIIATRASPDMPRATTHRQKQEQERESLALMVLERRRSKNAQPRNDAGGHIDAAFAVLPAVGV